MAASERNDTFPKPGWCVDLAVPIRIEHAAPFSAGWRIHLTCVRPADHERQMPRRSHCFPVAELINL
jgi:hypothetical protein